MDFWLSITPGGVSTCPSGVVAYVQKHLQSPKEAGCLARLPDYRDEAGLVRPHLYNLPLWWEVGHLPGTSRPQPKLLFNLCMGMNLSGNQLTETQLFQAPVEAVITLPSEVSQALEYHPKVAYPVLWAASSAYVSEMERFAISARVGARQSECREAETLTLAWFHARNKRDEPHFQAHVLTFAPAMDEFGQWYAHVNREFMRHHLHVPGGAREKAVEAVITELARHEYQMDIFRGKANPDRHHGARVVCPDGFVIEPGTIPRLRGAEVQARKALWLELGASWLTTLELPLVLAQAGQYPLAGAGGQRQEKFQRKLERLQLLDADGRITQDLVSALSRLDASLARVEIGLRDLPFQEAGMASKAIRARRDELHDQVPGICTDDWQVYHAWTTTYDGLLELVATGGFNWAALSPATQNTLNLLALAGVVKTQWEAGWPAYRLTRKGEARRQIGLQEAREIAAVVPELFAHVTTGNAQPAVVLGRLQLAGVHVRGTLLEFRRLGRVTEAGEQIREAGIGPSTPSIPDYDWWRWYWDHRHELSPVLAKVVLRPEELPAPKPKRSLSVGKPAMVDPSKADPEPIYIPPSPANNRIRQITPRTPEVQSLKTNLEAQPSPPRKRK